MQNPQSIELTSALSLLLAPAPAAPAPPSARARIEDDAVVLRAFRAGDRKAFAELVRRYQRPVYRLALRYAQDVDEADELAQRTFLRVLDHLSRGGGLDSFRSFVFRVAANLCKNHLRDRAKLVLGVPLSVAAPEGTSAEERELRRHVREALAKLPRRQREVVSLRIDAELSFAEIGAALGITENNAKVCFHYGVQRLREQLKEEERP